MRISLGYELEVRGRTREIERRTFHNVVDQVVLGDELGYDTASFVEHHFTRGFSHSSAPDLVLAAISQRTARIRLGLGVVLLPFQSPIRTAETVATLDILSGGRVEFGTGRGASPLEYQAFRRPFEKSRQIWEDTLEAVLAICRDLRRRVGAPRPGTPDARPRQPHDQRVRTDGGHGRLDDTGGRPGRGDRRFDRPARARHRSEDRR